MLGSDLRHESDMVGVNQLLSDSACATTQEREKQAPGAEKLRKSVADRTARIATLQQRINEVKDRIFADFSKQVHISVAMLEKYHPEPGRFDVRLNPHHAASP